MGLISTISDRKEKKIEARQSATEIPPPTGGPVLCGCRCPRVWWDRSGGGPYCAGCRPAPSRHLVGATRDMCLDKDGRVIWESSEPYWIQFVGSDGSEILVRSDVDEGCLDWTCHDEKA